MRISPDCLFVADDQTDMLCQKLLIDTSAKESHHRNIKLGLIHIVDQVHKHLFGTAMAKIMDKEQDFQKGQHLSFC